MREQELAKLKDKQSIAMRQSWADAPDYKGATVNMTDALTQVRTSNATIPVELSRFHGSYLYNKQG